MGLSVLMSLVDECCQNGAKRVLNMEFYGGCPAICYNNNQFEKKRDVFIANAAIARWRRRYLEFRCLVQRCSFSLVPF